MIIRMLYFNGFFVFLSPTWGILTPIPPLWPRKDKKNLYIRIMPSKTSLAAKTISSRTMALHPGAVSILSLILMISSLIASSCRQSIRKAGKVIILQPLGDFSTQQAELVYKEVKSVNPNTFLRKPLPLPSTAYYPSRGRYRADSLIRYLARFGSADTVLAGLTGKDISTTKGQIKDWGVMGLGYCPGNACIISTYRLSKTDLDSQFYKVVMHELGHTEGLPHCMDMTCFMRDAEGGNPLNKEKGFCPVCKRFLISRGWNIQFIHPHDGISQAIDP